jgi:hypothetical protein
VPGKLGKAIKVPWPITVKSGHNSMDELAGSLTNPKKTDWVAGKIGLDKFSLQA